MPYCSIKWCGKRSATSSLTKDGITFHRNMASLIAVLADELEDSTCRCCLSIKGCKIVDRAYYSSGEKEVYTDMLSETFGIKLLLSDEVVSAYSKLICDQCISRLRNAARFKVQIMDCEEQFTRLLARKSLESEYNENQEDTSCEQSKPIEEVATDDYMSIEYLEEGIDENADYIDEVSMESQDDKRKLHGILNEISMPEETLDDESDRIQVKEETIIVDVKYEEEVLEDSDCESLGYDRQSNDDEYFGTIDEPPANCREDVASGDDSEDPLSPKPKRLKKLLQKHAEGTEKKQTKATKARHAKPLKKYLEDPQVREKFIKTFLAEPKVNIKSKKVREHLNAQKRDSEKIIERLKIAEGLKKLFTGSKIDSKTTIRNAELIIKHTTAYPFRLLNSLIRCAYCYDTFHTADVWREHVDFKHPKCAFSDFVYSGKRFERIRVDINGLRCRICSAEADDLNDIVEHLIIKHNKPFNKKCDLGVMPFKIIHDDMTCLICSERHPTLLRLASHVGSHFDDFVCPTCGKGFSKFEHLYLHKKEHASEFRCIKCESNFETHEDLKAHMKMHPATRKCNVCGEVFKHYPERLKHMIKEHDYPAPVYKCNICSIKFEKKATFQWHNLNHHAPMPFECEYCGAKFVRQRLLNLHLVKHTGDKNYHCDICGKTFPRRSALRIHQRIHTNDRRYICQFCEQAFVQRTSLVLHLRNHHRDQMET